MDNMELINNVNYISLYKSPIGKFFIKYNLSLEKWDLGIGDEVFGYYVTTIQTADGVYYQSTGCYEWERITVIKVK